MKTLRLTRRELITVNRAIYDWMQLMEHQNAVMGEPDPDENFPLTDRKSLMALLEKTYQPEAE
ncbi:hypothetical protein KGP36_01805 [Patescibacteria group bacterium]|nr:hypothetical protein [Patescibacteria group bacterium]